MISLTAGPSSNLDFLYHRVLFFFVVCVGFQVPFRLFHKILLSLETRRNVEQKQQFKKKRKKNKKKNKKCESHVIARDGVHSLTEFFFDDRHLVGGYEIGIALDAGSL